MSSRKPNYRLEKKARERARDLRQTEKLSRRKAAEGGAQDSKNPVSPADEPVADEAKLT